MRVTALVTIAVMVPYLLPFVSHEAVGYYAELYSDIPLILAGLVSFQYGLSRVASSVERRFWHLFTVAFACWLLVRLIGIVTTVEWYVDVRTGLTIDLLYVLFYLSIALALELEPHRATAGTLDDLLRSFRSWGSIVFMFGLLGYFAVIPGALDPEAYDTWVPSLLLIVSLDLYLIVRLLMLRRTAGGRWHRVYTLLAATAGFWLATDGYEALSYVWEGIWIDSGTLLDAAWLPPFLTIVAAARARELWGSPGAVATGRQEEPIRAFLSKAWGGPLVAYVVAIPVIHFGLYGLGVLDASVRGVREVWLAMVLLALATLAFVHERLLQRERVRLEKVARETQEQLQHAQRLEAVGQLTAGIAHDFNNLLTVILANTALLRRHLSERGREATEVDEIEDASRTGATLVEKLLAFAQRRRLTPTEVDLAEVVDELLPTLRRLVPESIEISVSGEGSLPLVRVDPGSIEQVLMNLVTNARDAMPSGGRLRIECRRERGEERDTHRSGLSREREYVTLSVIDSGSGMDERTRSRVFEPFFTTKPFSEGSGLGMAVVYGVVAQQGGFIEIESEEGEGTTVNVFLPVSDGASERHV